MKILYQRVAEARTCDSSAQSPEGHAALEIAHFGQDLANEETDYAPYLICLDDERSLIYDRINRRVDRMLEGGLLDEARWLLSDGPIPEVSRRA